jgi:hypothetical protein
VKSVTAVRNASDVGRLATEKGSNEKKRSRRGSKKLGVPSSSSRLMLSVAKGRGNGETMRWNWNGRRKRDVWQALAVQQGGKRESLSVRTAD